jgi:hypothetical protein
VAGTAATEHGADSSSVLPLAIPCHLPEMVFGYLNSDPNPQSLSPLDRKDREIKIDAILMAENNPELPSCAS